MIISTVVAVALGLVPVEGSKPQTIQVDERSLAAEVGRYSQSVDRSGVTHVRGFDRAGRAYDLTLDGSGKVDGLVGDMAVEFTVTDAS